MNKQFASSLFTALLFAQGLLGFAGLASVLIGIHADDDRIAVVQVAADPSVQLR